MADNQGFSPRWIVSRAEARATSREELFALVGSVCKSFGFSRFLLALFYPFAPSEPTTVLVSNFPRSFGELYDNDSDPDFDPAVRHCLRRATPILWTADAVERPDEEGIIMWPRRKNIERELRCGVILPIHGAANAWGMLNLAREDALQQARATIEAALPQLQMLAGYIFEEASLLVKSHDCATGSRLTRRQEECLVWCSEGKTSWEIATILGIAERTVIYHLQQATGRLRASNRMQAVVRALPHLSWLTLRLTRPPHAIRVVAPDNIVTEGARGNEV